MVDRQTGVQIKTIRTDKGKGFVNSEFSSYLKSCGIQHQTTVPYRPQQNGNRSIVEKARFLMANAIFLKYFGKNLFERLYA